MSFLMKGFEIHPPLYLSSPCLLEEKMYKTKAEEDETCFVLTPFGTGGVTMDFQVPVGSF